MTHKHQVLILGAGYAGLMAALRLARKSRRRTTAITLVNAGDCFVERVRYHQLASNQPVKQISVPRVLRGTGINFVQGWVAAIQPDAKTVTVQTAEATCRLSYDKLVYALGSTTDRSRVPGVDEHAFTLDFESAALMGQRASELAARGGCIVIVGGGTTGIEAATELAESMPNLQVALVTNRAFGAFLSEKGRHYVFSVFDKLGITIHEHKSVKRVESDRLVLQEGGEIPFDLCLWAGGFTVAPLAKFAGIAVNDTGQILTDPGLRSLSHPDIIGVGDASTPQTRPGAIVRMGCYSANMLGAAGADTVLAEVKGQQPNAFGLSYLVQAISLGRRQGLIQVLTPDADPTNWIITGRTGAAIKDFLLGFAFFSIRIQKWMPAFLQWPGKYRMRHISVPAQPVARTSNI